MSAPRRACGGPLPVADRPRGRACRAPPAGVPAGFSTSPLATDALRVRLLARILTAVNTSTNSRVVYWAAFESIVLVCMSVGQVYYLNRFFEVRTTV